jgi:hypothetical protein
MAEKLARLNGKFDWYYPNQRALVCPIDYYHRNFNKEVEKLKQLGCQIVGEIECPVDIGVRFVQVILPGSLRCEIDEEAPDIIECIDSKDRTRLRVTCRTSFLGTVIFTRYWPSTSTAQPEKGLLPTVIDLEATDEDGEGGEIWLCKRVKRGLGYHELREKAEEWLNKHYPNWENPAAYWTHDLPKGFKAVDPPKNAKLRKLLEGPDIGELSPHGSGGTHIVHRA